MTRRSMNKAKAKEMLLGIKETFDDLKIKFWLADGTCLGAVRDGCFIPRDYDIDVIMLARDFSPTICEALGKVGHIYLVRRYPDKIYAITVGKKGWFGVDIYLGYYFSPKDIYIVLQKYPSVENAILPSKLLQGDCWVNFLDTTFRVPNPPEEYLERLYKKDWRTPLDWTQSKIWREQYKQISNAKFTEYIHWIEKHPEEVGDGSL